MADSAHILINDRANPDIVETREPADFGSRKLTTFSTSLSLIASLLNIKINLEQLTVEEHFTAPLHTAEEAYDLGIIDTDNSITPLDVLAKDAKASGAIYISAVYPRKAFRPLPYLSNQTPIAMAGPVFYNYQSALNFSYQSF